MVVTKDLYWWERDDLQSLFDEVNLYEELRRMGVKKMKECWSCGEMWERVFYPRDQPDEERVALCEECSASSICCKCGDLTCPDFMWEDAQICRQCLRDLDPELEDIVIEDRRGSKKARV